MQLACAVRELASPPVAASSASSPGVDNTNRRVILTVAMYALFSPVILMR